VEPRFDKLSASEQVELVPLLVGRVFLWQNKDMDLMDKIVSLCKRRGFVYPGSEIYGGLGGTWDYGPLGVALKRHVKNEWWKTNVLYREDAVGMDAAIMMNPKVWEASGHTEAFSDPLIECKTCKKRFRADQIPGVLVQDDRGKVPAGTLCPSGGHELDVGSIEWVPIRKFNLLVKSYLGVVEGQQSEVFLRGEITQGVHVNFRNILDSTRIKVPFGVGQIGKAFRNEITPGNFTFRSREFEQMEMQFYIRPDDEEGRKWFDYWKEQRMSWYTSLGIQKEKLRFRDHEPDERAHYARAATDVEYNSPFGWKEFEGIHHRGDWDLTRHQKYSGVDMKYRDPDSGEEFVPWVIETSGGVDRATLFFLIDAYKEEEKRVVLQLDPRLSPYKVAVFPLVANKPQLVEKAKKIFSELKHSLLAVTWDDRGNIGKRYYAQDEIGTPWCVTIDYQTLEDDTVTVRDRDTTGQERLNIANLLAYFQSQLEKND